MEITKNSIIGDVLVHGADADALVAALNNAL